MVTLKQPTTAQVTGNKIMQEIEIAQSPLSSINPTEYTISIRLRPGGFCFSLYHVNESKHTCLYDLNAATTTEVASKLEGMGIRAKEFAQVYIVDDCKRWTLVPLNMEGLDTNSLWKLNFGNEAEAALKTTDIAPARARCVFEPSQESQELLQLLGKGQIDAIQTADIVYSLRESQSTNNDFMGIDIRGKQTNFYLAKRGRLELANSYNTETSTDILYYAMNLVRTFQLSQTEMTARIWGQVPDKLTHQLGQYIKDVEKSELDEHYNYANGIKKLGNNQEYFDLFNIATCAL